jgi:hypothetical protein
MDCLPYLKDLINSQDKDLKLFRNFSILSIISALIVLILMIFFSKMGNGNIIESIKILIGFISFVPTIYLQSHILKRRERIISLKYLHTALERSDRLNEKERNQLQDKVMEYLMENIKTKF